MNPCGGHCESGGGGGGWGGRHSYNRLYGEALPKRGTFFRMEVYKRIGISRVEVQKMAGKTAIWVLKGTFKVAP